MSNLPESNNLMNERGGDKHHQIHFLVSTKRET